MEKARCGSAASRVRTGPNMGRGLAFGLTGRTGEVIGHLRRWLRSACNRYLRSRT